MLFTVGCALMIRYFLLIILLVLSLCSAAVAEPSAHFHHLHLNTTDPVAAIKFYTGKFDCEQRRFLDQDAVWAQQSWILFNKVKTAPPWQLTSAIWHFGWGAEDMDFKSGFKICIIRGYLIFVVTDQPLGNAAWLV